MKIWAVVGVFLLVNICLVSAQPTCTTLSSSCTCNDASLPISQEYSYCYEPDRPAKSFNAPSDLLVNEGQSYKYETFFGTNIIVFTNLYYGVTYEFSTCSRPTISNPSVDVVLVLRDPDQNFITANDDCLMYASPVVSTPCSYITYSHTSYDFDTVYLSVYPKRVSPKGEVLCSVDTGRNGITIFGAATYSPVSPPFDCLANLACYPDGYSVQVESGDAIDESDFFDSSNSDLCGGNVYLYLDDDPVAANRGSSSWDCDLYGNYTVTVQLFNKFECKVPVFFYNERPLLSCALNNAQIYPTELSSYCQFTGKECAIAPMDYVPNIVFNSDPCGNGEYQYEVTPYYPQRVLTLGDSFGYIIEETTTNAFVYCSESFFGIQPYSLLRYSTGEEFVDHATLYFDTVYVIEYNATYPALGWGYDVDIQVLSASGDPRFSSGSEGQNDLNEFPYYYNSDVSVPSYGGTVQGYSFFCVPSEYEYYYDFQTQMEILLRGNYINSNGAAAPGSFSPLNPPEIINVDFGKRDSFDYVNSLGNPHVYFTYAVNPSDRDVSCTDNNIVWFSNGPPPVPPPIAP